MKQVAALILSLLLVLLLCACQPAAEPPEETSSPVPETPVPNETSGITGFRNGNSIRFDTFGLTVTIPETALENWEMAELPSTLEELDAVMAVDQSCGICWGGFETSSGSASIYIQVLPCGEDTRNIYVMEYFMETFPKEHSVNRAEIKQLSLGEYPWQDVFLADRKDGTNTLIFDRVAGLYRIECTVETFGYLGAEALAQEIFCVDAPEAEKRYETSSTVGHLLADQLRFDDYGFSLRVDSESFFDACRLRPMPQSFDDMASYFEDDWFQLIWQDFEDEQGRWSVSISLAPIPSGLSEAAGLHYTGEYFKEEFETSHCEIIPLALGDNETQKCLLVTFCNDDGAEENLLYITKLNGDYRLECSVSTYDYQGAIEKAQELFRVDAPKPLPFTIEESGFFRLEDSSLFGKTLKELHDLLGPFPAPVEFPWWGNNLRYACVDCNGYSVSLLIDSDNKLYGVICENVEGSKFDTAFEEVTSRHDIYYYLDASESDFFLHDKVYRFYRGDAFRFDFGKCDDGDGGTALCQRYVATPITDYELIDMANYIVTGVLPELSNEHAAHLAEFVENRCGSPETADDIDICIGIANFHLNMKEYEKYLGWGETIVRLDGRGSAARSAALFNGNVLSKLGEYSKSDLPRDCSKAAEYYFLAMGSADPGLKSEAEDRLVSLWFNAADELSEDVLQQVEAAVVRIVQEKPNQYLSKVYDRVKEKLAPA